MAIIERQKREKANWIFSRELKDSNVLEGEDKRPYVITPLGTRVKRVLITGRITFKNSDEKMVKITLADYIGSFYITAFKSGFNSDMAEEVDKYNVNDTVVIMGKVSAFKTEDNVFYFSINPEMIKPISEIERYFWGERSFYIARRKIYAIREINKDEEANEETLIKLGYTREEAEDAVRSKNYYKDYDFNSYLSAISAINYEMPSNEAVKTETGGQEKLIPDVEGFILDYIKNNDDGPGCRYDDIIIAAKNEGITQEQVDETLNLLGSNGDIYEVSLKRYKAL
ncbi:hypothetical protein SE19_03055 [Acidiplasma aeolicum]|jgi:RPA family protein|uniref:OB domain-containing protein n=1 Tax=Acidiplasma aeolicum TaxID=507754 RepID=A0A0P9CN40_9ARCH|nr:OB-fold nucleic acid binding domain-containing protein [Acidiplasma aeolicum]KPV46992.1 hypothetical protein SE19_03055 [Acidiplasma aeolicum]